MAERSGQLFFRLFDRKWGLKAQSSKVTILQLKKKKSSVQHEPDPPPHSARRVTPPMEALNEASP